MATGLSRTRRQSTTVAGAEATPTAVNSLTSSAKPAEVALTWSIIDSVAMLTTNWPVAAALSALCLPPTAVNCTTIGSVELTEKKLNGARLSTPSALREDTQAIGRGTIAAVISL